MRRFDKPATGVVEADPAWVRAEPEFASSLLALYGALEFEAFLVRLARSTQQFSGADSAILLAPGEERKSAIPLATTWTTDDRRLAALRPIDIPGYRRLAQGDGEISVGFGPLASLFHEWPEPEPAASMALPVEGSGGDLGAVLLLLFGSAPAAPVIERLRRWLERVRGPMGNALQVRALRELVIKDDTAHCFNRRYFETSLPEELARASRFQTALSLIFLDMDNLKEVNKRHGHAMGSRTLAEVSRRIRSKIRRFDRLFRFGGDEFCVLLPETEWHGAIEVAERVRDTIARQPFLADDVNDGGIRMTASLGIASFPLHARTERELVEQADRAMQRIKNGTKNSIGIAEILGDDDGR